MILRWKHAATNYRRRTDVGLPLKTVESIAQLSLLVFSANVEVKTIAKSLLHDGTFIVDVVVTPIG